MNAIIPLLASNTLLAAMLGLLAWLVWRILHNPAAAHALCVAALIKLITPALLTVSITSPSLSISAREPASARIQTRAVSEAPLKIVEDSIAIGGGSSPSWRKRVGGFLSQQALFLFWVVGSLLYFVVTGSRIFRFQKSLTRWSAAPPALQAEVNRVAQRLGLEKTPRVFTSQERVSPAVWAVLGKPCVLLPLPLLAGMESGQREALLAHELCHVRRGDHWLRLLEWLVKGLLWWNPVVWAVSWGIRESEELCCDALVVKTMPNSARVYAAALLQTVDFLSLETGPPLRTGLAPVRHMERRIKMIAANNLHSTVPGPVRVLLFGLASTLLSLSLIAAAEPRQEPAPTSPAGEQREERPVADEDWRETMRQAIAEVREAISKARISPQIREALNQKREEIRAAMAELRTQRETIRPELRESVNREEIRTRIREALEKTRRLTEEERKEIQEKLFELDIDHIVDTSLEAAMSAVAAIDVDAIVEQTMLEVDVERIVESSLKAVEEILEKLERQQRQN